MASFETRGISARALELADRVETFVRDVIAPYESDARLGVHGPTEDMVVEMRDLARKAGVLTPHILQDGSHLTHRETAAILMGSIARGWRSMSPMGAAIAAK